MSEDGFVHMICSCTNVSEIPEKRPSDKRGIEANSKIIFLISQ